MFTSSVLSQNTATMITLKKNSPAKIRGGKATTVIELKCQKADSKAVTEGEKKRLIIAGQESEGHLLS